MICDTLIRLTRLCYRNHPNFPTSLHPPRAYTEESASLHGRAGGHIAKGRVEMLRRLFEAIFHRLFFTWMYRRGRTPWDTGISPPELVEAVEGVGAMPPGRALDLGCGTGTNCLYMARNGWQAIGVDFAAPAITRAKRKARAMSKLPGAVRFIHGVINTDNIAISGEIID